MALPKTGVKDTIIFNPLLVLPEDLDNDGLDDVLIYEEDTDEVNLYLSAEDGGLGQTADLSISATSAVISTTEYQWQYIVTANNLATEAINNVA